MVIDNQQGYPSATMSARLITSSNGLFFHSGWLLPIAEKKEKSSTGRDY